MKLKMTQYEDELTKLEEKAAHLRQLTADSSDLDQNIGPQNSHFSALYLQGLTTRNFA